ncbi:MAG: zinc ribbon domain-containing protein [Lentisphaerae bacterium]|nr:zinc ribbon domain-containing protein [Lentisphaerota bacterium]
MTPPNICPVCGAKVPPAARACPECGADETTGWNEDRAVYDGLDLPDNEFDYDAYLKKEFGDAEELRGKPNKLLIWLLLIGLALTALIFSIVLIS